MIKKKKKKNAISIMAVPDERHSLVSGGKKPKRPLAFHICYLHPVCDSGKGLVFFFTLLCQSVITTLRRQNDGPHQC